MGDRQKRQLFVKRNVKWQMLCIWLVLMLDVHMTDLISGRETLEDIQFIGAVGGFSNSDVLGSAKGWAGAFKYNEKSKYSFEKFL
jgi:phosphoribosylformylglycinamidine (FGAM) synthase-like amidotransferase family enzyme